MNKKKILFFVCLSLFSVVTQLFAQQVSNEEIVVKESRAYAFSLYTRAVRDQLLLFNGVDYKEFPEPYDGTPYFLQDEDDEAYENGSVRYFNETYHDVPMKYDMFRDELIIEHFDQRGFVAPVKLHQDHITDFTLIGHTFIRVSSAGNRIAGLRDGFYDQLHDGSLKVLVRRKKNLHETITSSMIVREFNLKTNYYVVMSGVAHAMRGKASAFKLMKDKKRLLKQFVNREKLDFSQNFESSLVRLVNHYEGLDHLEK